MRTSAMLRQRPAPVFAALAVALIAAVAASSADAQRKPAKPKTPKAPAVEPACEDFYSFVNADWLALNPVPTGNSNVSALSQLQLRAQQQQRDLLDAAMQAPTGNVQKLLGDFWASGLDEAAVERDGANAIAPLLSRIDAIRRGRDVAPAIAALHQVGIPVVFNFTADVDLTDLDRHVGYFGQGGLGLPDPAYYTRTDADTRAILARYRTYVEKILTLTGVPAAQLAAASQAVIDLETRIAQSSKPLVQMRDPRANYAATPTSALGKQYRGLQLGDFLKAQGVTDDTVSLADPALFAYLDSLVGGLPVQQWKSYLRWRVGDAMAPYLSRSYRDAEHEFRGRVLRGDITPPPRWQQVLNAINLAAGPMLGREYAARYLPGPTRSRAGVVAEHMREALRRGIDANTWMTEPTKAEARSKLRNLKVEIGTPRRDLDYTVQPMGRGSFGGNMLIASTWRHGQEMRRIGRGNADRRWDVLPQEPALAYDLAHNRLVVTAAVLQAPVLDINADPAAHYGSFGALVGHELSHGFDNKGRAIDARQQLRDWWTPADAAGWDARAMRVVGQYGAYPYPGQTGISVNGRQTRDENVADLAGVELALDAMQAAGPAAPQPFFQSWAKLWVQRLGVDAAAEQAAIDVHAPGQWRTNGPLAHQPGFGQAYACKDGAPRQRPIGERVSFWR